MNDKEKQNDKRERGGVEKCRKYESGKETQRESKRQKCLEQSFTNSKIQKVRCCSLSACDESWFCSFLLLFLSLSFAPYSISNQSRVAFAFAFAFDFT